MFSSRPLARSTSRRRLLGGGAAGAVGLAALSLGMPRLSGSAPATAAAQTGPWTGGDVPPASRSSRQMAAAARAFLNGLGSDHLSSVWHPDLGDQARTQWSNFPAGMSPRPGVALGDLSEGQRVLLHDLLRASTSSQGYHKMAGAMRADQVLHDLQGEQLFGSAYYYTTVYGTPEDPNWAWMLTGHHLSAIFTVSGDRTAFTPMFTGAQPLQIPSGLDAGWQVLPQDAGRAGELLAALSADQQQLAIIGTSAPGDVVAGPGRQASLSSYQGIPAGQLDDGQQRLLWLLVQEFVRNADFDAAEAQLALVQQGWGDTHFAWQGPPPDASARYYFRVHGPRILIEYDVQEPLASQGGHVHAITRDPTNDYGMDWLGLHYQESSSGPGGPGGPRGAPPGGATPTP
jgi:Protein of unknown function (DUF3500)